jgi:hypothetical protein
MWLLEARFSKKANWSHKAMVFQVMQALLFLKTSLVKHRYASEIFKKLVTALCPVG